MSTSSPHDAVFKQFLSDPATARDFLEIHLPLKLRGLFDLSTLRLESGSFIDPDMSAYYSDILYAAEAAGHTGYVYCVIEHQSTPDKLMAFRLMRYCLAAMQNHLRKGHDRLPLVVPLLFYHGHASPYPSCRRWLDLFDEPAAAAALYTDEFPLIDVTVIPDEAILHHRRVALLELVQKHIRLRDMMELSNELCFLLGLNLCSREQLETLLNYILQVGETAQPEVLLRTLACSVPQDEEVVMSIAEKLREEWTREVRQEGRQEGRQEVARALLAQGIDRAIVRQCTGLSDPELDRLCH